MSHHPYHGCVDPTKPHCAFCERCCWCGTLRPPLTWEDYDSYATGAPVMGVWQYVTAMGRKLVWRLRTGSKAHWTVPKPWDRR